MAETLQDSAQLESTTVKINRTAATVKGGRRMSFSALVVVGDRRGSVGIGYGKAPGVPAAIEKAQKDARKHLVQIRLQEGTLPHPVTGRFGASKVRLIPAAPGTGVVAGATVRAVLEMVGVSDCLTKAYGSTNEINMVRAVMSGLENLTGREALAQLRNVEIPSTTVDETIERSRKSMAAEEAKAMAAAAKVREKATAVEAERKAEEKAKEDAAQEEKAAAEDKVEGTEPQQPEKVETEGAEGQADTKAPEQASADNQSPVAEEAANQAADQAENESNESQTGDTGEAESQKQE